jgi:hypothetical protein
MQLGQIYIAISANTAPLQQGLNQAMGQVRQFGANVAQQVGGGGGSSVRGAMNAASDAASRLTLLGFTAQRAWGGFLDVSGIRTAARFEVMERGFATLTGSMSTARRVVGELAQLGAETPFDTEQLTSYARRLLGMGIAADQVVPKMRVLADTAGALGLRTEGLGRLALIMGQINQGSLTATMANRFGYLGLNFAQVVGQGSGRQFQTRDEALSYLRTLRTGAERAEVIFRGLDRMFQGASANLGQTFEFMAQNIGEQFSLGMKPTGDLLLGPLETLSGAVLRAAGLFNEVNTATHGMAGLGIALGAGVWAVTSMVLAGWSAASALYYLAGAARMAAASQGFSGNFAGFARGQATGLAVDLAMQGAGLGLNLWGASQAESAKTPFQKRWAAMMQGAGTGLSVGAGIGRIFGIPGALLGGGLGALIGAFFGAKGEHDRQLAERGHGQSAMEKHTAAVQANTEALMKMKASLVGGGARAKSGLLGFEYAMARAALTGVG